MTTTNFAAGAYAAAQNFLSGAGATAPDARSDAGGFGALLSGAIENATRTGRVAEGQAVAAATGRADIVDVVTAVAESETALQTLVSVRDRMISAYEEIMRMQI